LVRQLHLPQHWAEDLQGKIRLRRLAPGEAIIRENDPGDSIFALLTGRAHVVHAEERQEPYTGLFWAVQAELDAGAWFGEMSLLTGAPRNATVIAASAAEVIEIPKEAIEASLKREPEVLERLVDLMDKRQSGPDSSEPTTPVPLRGVLLKQLRGWFKLG
jgi:CRP-like cAMP-binding protein